MKNRSSDTYTDPQIDTSPPPENPAQTTAKKIWRWSELLFTTLSILGLYIFGAILTSMIFFLRDTDALTNTKALDTIASSFSYLNAYLIIEAIMPIVVISLLITKRKHLGWGNFGFRGTTKRWIAIASGLGIVGGILTVIVNNTVTISLFQLSNSADSNMIGTTGITWTNIFIFCFVLSISIPLATEMYFLGVLYPFMRERWGIWSAIVGNILLQGILTGEVAGIISAVISVLLTIAIYERSRSLWTAVIVSCAINVILLVASLATTSLHTIPLW